MWVATVNIVSTIARLECRDHPYDCKDGYDCIMDVCSGIGETYEWKRQVPVPIATTRIRSATRPLTCMAV
ncbi:MAG: hypothetical protein GXP49_02605 [Deltaproteobacteria bacterium]|nr:hypothetical protein [Deltaproteobacteria bacterium]